MHARSRSPNDVGRKAPRRKLRAARATRARRARRNSSTPAAFSHCRSRASAFPHPACAARLYLLTLLLVFFLSRSFYAFRCNSASFSLSRTPSFLLHPSSVRRPMFHLPTLHFSCVTRSRSVETVPASLAACRRSTRGGNNDDEAGHPPRSLHPLGGLRFLSTCSLARCSIPTELSCSTLSSRTAPRVPTSDHSACYSHVSSPITVPVPGPVIQEIPSR